MTESLPTVMAAEMRVLDPLLSAQELLRLIEGANNAGILELLAQGATTLDTATPAVRRGQAPPRSPRPALDGLDHLVRCPRPAMDRRPSATVVQQLRARVERRRRRPRRRARLAWTGGPLLATGALVPVGPEVRRSDIAYQVIPSPDTPPGAIDQIADWLLELIS